jgi:hypothetical protein
MPTGSVRTNQHPEDKSIVSNTRSRRLAWPRRYRHTRLSGGLIARAPAVAALFEFVFEIERGLFRPNPNGFSAGVLKQQRQRGSLSARNGVRQNFQQRMAVVDGPV